MIDAIGEEALASRVTLLALLSDGLAALEANCTSTPLIGIKREGVKHVLKTIVTRYGIDLADWRAVLIRIDAAACFTCQRQSTKAHQRQSKTRVNQ